MFESSGRPADIFSLGCIFFEILALCKWYTLDGVEILRSANDRSFQSNLYTVFHWIDCKGGILPMEDDNSLLPMVKQRMSRNPNLRPKAVEMQEMISALETEASSGVSTSLEQLCSPSLQNFGYTRPCCKGYEPESTD